MKNLQNLGQALTKAEQRTISGGRRLIACTSAEQNRGCYEKAGFGCYCPAPEEI